MNPVRDHHAPDLDLSVNIPLVQVDDTNQFLQDCASSAGGLFQQAQAAMSGTAMGQASNLSFLLAQAASRLATLVRLMQQHLPKPAPESPAEPAKPEPPKPAAPQNPPQQQNQPKK